MKKYYYDCPRGFANEYKIYSVESPTEQRAIAQMIDSAKTDLNRDIQRITRKEAEHLTAANRAKYRNGTANANHPAGATRIVPLWATMTI